MKTPLTPVPPAIGNSKSRLTPEQKAEIIRRLDAGERCPKLAREFGVSPQAISLYRKKDNGELLGAANKKMTAAETEKLRQVLEGSVPSQHGLANPDRESHDGWNPARAQALAEKMFGRKLFRLQFKEHIEEWLPPEARAHSSSRMREPMTVEEIKAIMAREAKFLEFVDSPVAGEIRNRELGRRIGRAADRLEMPPPEMWETLSPVGEKSRFSPQSMIPGPVRTGKHKGSKGSPFTKARKKKNR